MRVLSRFFVIVLVMAAWPLAAQVSSDSINVNATNVGAFIFNINEAAYDFGSISSLGGANVGGTEPGALVGVTGATNAVYTSSATAINWNVASAPARTVLLHNSSGAQVLTWGTANSLELNIPAVAVGTSCGFKGAGFTGAGGVADCTAGNLYHSMTGVGRGINDVDGFLQLRVTVDDAHATGTNTWVIQITATGS